MKFHQVMIARGAQNVRNFLNFLVKSANMYESQQIVKFAFSFEELCRNYGRISEIYIKYLKIRTFFQEIGIFVNINIDM